MMAGVQFSKLMETNPWCSHPDLINCEVSKLNIQRTAVLLPNIAPIKFDDANGVIDVAGDGATDAVFQKLLIQYFTFGKVHIGYFERT